MTDDELQQLTDEQLDERLQREWQLFQTVSRGSSTRAIDNRWAAYDRVRAEKHRRDAERRAQSS